MDDSAITCAEIIGEDAKLKGEELKIFATSFSEKKINL